MGPGPSDVSERVLKALSQQTIGHMDPSFVSLMNEIKSLLQYVFQTKNELTIPVSAPGSSGMETCFMNMVEPGDKILVCINGVFGMRMKEVATRAGAQVEAIEFEWGEAVEPEVVDQKLSENPDISMIAFVHAETSTGVRSDAKALCAIAQQHNCLSIVDAVTSLGGSDVQVDDWGIDAIYSGTQKCLSCIPGLSPVSFSTKAIEKIKAKSSKNYSWFLDLNLVMDYWGEGAKRTYHHTAPVNSLYALHESLLILKEEGLESAWERHELHHKALVAGLEALGIEMLVPKDIRLSQLNAVKIPEGIDDATVRSTLLNQYDLELGAGLGKFAGKAWRIGLMGNGCNRKNVDYCVSSLGAVLNELGHSCDVDAAMSAVENAYP
ncbi:alanine--glyoxylate aminotransferase [Oleiphilus sp. HI0078]|nr:alanine--glyoxylate aminotransferase [Oleiphilus sp. HI0043]KZY40735.1 alanine--glyoxylate aminotransferase [Oleiphilus sp. HI0050]KZY65719.1 alanine--glyoxylate aminotransferase [Oleiphilus sp. HI0061]KZY76189.1 alanine--glyoxylate aminotransferase [Oleiphilus sp. HI0069]KZY78166.1 alanine--glyoxylate aminotransferase [Oleiphilus sp. HI0068]KZY85608.1 alanine--glyoxylate aminotransferase [Oleiphilus sp. HI0072]KZZ19787.1 alanine--glyoxylate aminotransferase [Oleiphilus sp. HI0078]KZZ3135